MGGRSVQNISQTALIAASLLEAEHGWHHAEELPLSLLAVWGCGTQGRAWQLHAPAERNGPKNIWLRELYLILPRKSVLLCPFYKELRRGLMNGLGQLCPTSPEQARAAERSFARRALDFVQY